MINRSDMIKDNMGLVYACVKRFIGRGIEYDDLVQAGSIGLIKAVDGFDETKGFKLSTYAVPVILGEIKRLFRESGSVKISRSIKDLSMKISRTIELFKIDHDGISPKVSELSEIMKVEESKIVEAISSMSIPLSLTTEDENIDIPVESHDETITELISLRQAICDLTEKDRAIIILRFFKNKTQSNVAEMLGMTQVQVSRKEKKILNLLKSKMN